MPETPATREPDLGAVFDRHVAHEHIYWDRGSLLAQVGLLDPERIPVVGAEAATRLLELSRGG